MDSSSDAYFVTLHSAGARETWESVTKLHHTPFLDGLGDTWMNSLDGDTLLFALETLTMLLAGHVYVSFRDSTQEQAVDVVVRREIYSDIAYFYSFVVNRMHKKYVSRPKEQIRTLERRDCSDELAQYKPIITHLPIASGTTSDERYIVIEEESDGYLVAVAQWFNNFCGIRYPK